MDKRLIVGLTGGICCGKSTVSKTFLKYSIPIVDADQVARDVVVSNSIGLKQVIGSFGDAHLNTDGSLNRITLGKFVFDHPEELKKLNSIMMPLITEEADKQIDAFKKAGHSIIVYDAALIFEMGNASKYHPLIVAYCSSELQLDRLMKRNSLTREDAMARINAQMPVEEKMRKATFLIDTNGSIEDSIKQTEKIILALKDVVK